MKIFLMLGTVKAKICVVSIVAMLCVAGLMTWCTELRTKQRPYSGDYPNLK